MRFVDTNIFLRFLINDVPHQANACEALFRRTVAGEKILLTNDMVIAEILAYGSWSPITSFLDRRSATK